ncbi:Uncharacterised protein [Klebsiella variicola]|nr:Uncharacterised protein [Klebsiella variicola]
MAKPDWEAIETAYRSRAMLSAPGLQTPLNGIISPSESESKPSPKKLTGLQEYVREQCLN